MDGGACMGILPDILGLASLAPARAQQDTHEKLVNRAQRVGAECAIVVLLTDAA
jgi:hypothetical protein